VFEEEDIYYEADTNLESDPLSIAHDLYLVCDDRLVHSQFVADPFPPSDHEHIDPLHICNNLDYLVHNTYHRDRTIDSVDHVFLVALQGNTILLNRQEYSMVVEEEVEELKVSKDDVGPNFWYKIL
jgi:hypothetical protein